MTSGGAVNISQEQLQQVAERLGLTSLNSYGERSKVGNESRFPGTHYWGGEFLYGGGGGTRYVHWSDGDLLLAILNRAAEMGGKPEITFCDPYDMDWRVQMVVGTKFHREHNDDLLEAAILAFVQLPLPASQGDA